jgi:hypothetical protein
VSYRGLMDIGPPPEFGRDGSDPPLVSVSVHMASWPLNKSFEKFMMESMGMAITSKDLMKYLNPLKMLNPLTIVEPYQKLFSYRSAIKRMMTDNQIGLSSREVMKWSMYARYDRFWQREDPVTQLPPGGSSEVTVLLRIGMSEEHASELARSLGVTGAVPHVGISAQLSSKSSTKVTISQAEETSHKITLTNSLDGAYRRFAIWHVVHMISMAAAPTLPPALPTDLLFDKMVCQTTEFVPSKATSVTMWPTPIA